MELKRKVELKVYADGSVISNRDFVGYKGENMATMLAFDLPENLIDNSYVYTLNFEDKNGNVNVGVMTFDNLSFALSNALTLTDSLLCQLTISKQENILFKSETINLILLESVELKQDIETQYIGLLTECIGNFNALTEKLGTADVSSFRGIVSIDKLETQNNIDTYKITYTDNSNSYFNVSNGTNGNDYVLSDDDKNQIANIVYQNYIADINSNLEAVLNGGVWYWRLLEKM